MLTRGQANTTIRNEDKFKRKSFGVKENDTARRLRYLKMIILWDEINSHQRANEKWKKLNR